MSMHSIISQSGPKQSTPYDAGLAPVIANFIIHLNNMDSSKQECHGQQYILQKGLKVFGYERGSSASGKELDQLHNRSCFAPLSVSSLTPSEKEKAMDALMLLTEKRDGTIKGRMVYNGKPTRMWTDKEDSASPTVSLESIYITAVIDAFEERDVMSADVPNAFIQTLMPPIEDGEDRVIMKITEC